MAFQTANSNDIFEIRLLRSELFGEFLSEDHLPETKKLKTDETKSHFLKQSKNVSKKGALF